MFSRVVRAAAPLVALLSACSRGPVEWAAAPSSLDQAAAGRQLALDASGAPTLAPPPPLPPTLPAGPRCDASVRVATLPRGAARATVVVWWAPRADGSAALLAAESLDEGRTWSAAVPVDTLDRGTNGCARPAPAIAADSASGYAHVAYPLWAPEGPGVFVSHTMPGHFMFHTPIVVSYGDRPGAVSVAASGNDVAVAYEDPNARAPRVGLALSRTQGHVLEHRALAPASAGDASTPLVALRDGRIAVAWVQRPHMAAAAAASATAAPPLTMVRTGTLAASDARPGSAETQGP
ncbi:MAG TPA: hypothetical protein VEA99_18055 [Gemmatimonadaceae bacterium]|nr:hypothetical protein [Gemmatimonadaceae bacterium]